MNSRVRLANAKGVSEELKQAYMQCSQVLVVLHRIVPGNTNHNISTLGILDSHFCQLSSLSSGFYSLFANTSNTCHKSAPFLCDCYSVVLELHRCCNPQSGVCSPFHSCVYEVMPFSNKWGVLFGKRAQLLLLARKKMMLPHNPERKAPLQISFRPNMQCIFDQWVCGD